MKTYHLYPTSINERYVDEIVEALRRGAVIAYPTDTGYALGCDALNTRATERVCRLRDINPAKQRLSVVCADLSQASEYARIDNHAFALLRRNLPGPFTFILPATTALGKLFKGRREVGVRIPDNLIARALAQALGNPLLSASAAWEPNPEAAGNDDPLLPPSDPEALALHYDSQIDILVSGGDIAPDGATLTPSAIVDLRDTSSPTILRQGPLPLAE